MKGDRLVLTVVVEDTGPQWLARSKVDVDSHDGLIDVDACRVAGLAALETVDAQIAEARRERDERDEPDEGAAVRRARATWMDA